MKNKLLAIIICFAFSQSSFSENDSISIFEEMRKESTTFNKTVTDEEIIEYFEAFLKYQPENLRAFRSHDPKERKSFLAEYRKAHEESSIKIPVLRGLSKDELKRFDEIAKYKAEEAIRIQSAQERLLSFSKEQYEIMIEEAVTLIRNYEAPKNENSSRQVIISSGYPEKLAFLNLEAIYLYKNRCELLLQNGIGKDIGYSISQDESSEWHIKSFDHYKSWVSSRIDLGN